MNGFDIALLIVMGILAVIGLMKGLVRILVGFAALVAAFIIASRFHRPLAASLEGLDVSIEIVQLLCYLGLFIAVMLAGAVLGFLVRRLVKVAMLSWADRLAGAALGVAAAFIAFSLLVVPIVAYTPDGAGILERSILAPYVLVVADLAARAAPDDLVDRFRERLGELRERWAEDRKPVAV
jgi:membrane protein required for colicin V production